MFTCFMARDNDSAGRGYLGDAQITALEEFLPGRKVFSPTHPLAPCYSPAHGHSQSNLQTAAVWAEDAWRLLGLKI